MSFCQLSASSDMCLQQPQQDQVPPEQQLKRLWQKGRTTRCESKREAVTAAVMGMFGSIEHLKSLDFHSAGGFLGFFAKGELLDPLCIY